MQVFRSMEDDSLVRSIADATRRPRTTSPGR